METNMETKLRQNGIKTCTKCGQNWRQDWDKIETKVETTLRQKGDKIGTQCRHNWRQFLC